MPIGTPPVTTYLSPLINILLSFINLADTVGISSEFEYSLILLGVTPQMIDN